MNAGRRLMGTLGTVALLTVATPAIALASEGAIAVNFHTGAVGRSWNYPTARGADARALAECRAHPRGRGGRCYVALDVTGGLCGALVRHRREDFGMGIGPDRRIVNGFGDTQREAIRQARPGYLLDSVCSDGP